MAVWFASLFRFLRFYSFFILCASGHVANALVGSEYVLDTEYSGVNFFDGWDFFTGNDPTGGFVTYYSRSSSQLTGLINSSVTAPAYMGVDYVNELPVTSAGSGDGAGRPSVRISTQRSWTHGLIIGDFSHIPSGICGTWPAFWTLGPDWPSTGEVDIMEGVNKMVSNVVALHTNETCFVNGTSSTQLGTMGNTNCAYYPDYNVGCGVADPRPASYSTFNSNGGGVYAMQWTSEYIRVWYFSRDLVPQDITNQQPDPSTWGLPAANMMGDCNIDQHFQQHKIVFDTTFCGQYAGIPSIWNSSVNSCAVDTGYSTCDAYVAKQPGAFRDAYWSINYVRVYQLMDPASPATEPGYIASLQPANPTDQTPSSQTPAPVPSASLCPTYNFTTIQQNGFTYEIECDYDPPGPDIPPPYPNYPIHSFEDCVAGCTYWNANNGTNTCGAVSYDASIPFCYFKKYIDQPPKYRAKFAGARLIYYGYPQITDDPRSQTVSSTSGFTEIIPTPQLYRPLSTVSNLSNTFTSFNTTSAPIPTIVAPPLGTTTNETARPTVDAGIPTVSYSGSNLIPVTNLSSYTPSPSAATPTSTTVSNLGAELNITAASTVTNITIIITTDLNELTSSTSTSQDEPTSTITRSATIFTTLLVSQTITSSQTPSAISNSLPGPSVVADFRYVGCRGSTKRSEAFELVEVTSNMTIERCLSNCAGSYYAGVIKDNCWCANTPSATDLLVEYPDSACDIPCPGDVNQEDCGGIAPTSDANGSPTSVFLLTLYANSKLLPNVGLSSTVVETITFTVIPITHSPTSFSYNVTGTNIFTITAIATTWCDFCSTCPGYETTRTTTITVPCPIQQSIEGIMLPTLTVPMMTTTRQCDCGPDGSRSTTTVTIPCEAQIAPLMSAAQQITAGGHMNGGFFVPMVANPALANSEMDYTHLPDSDADSMEVSVSDVNHEVPLPTILPTSALAQQVQAVEINDGVLLPTSGVAVANVTNVTVSILPVPVGPTMWSPGLAMPSPFTGDASLGCVRKNRLRDMRSLFSVVLGIFML